MPIYFSLTMGHRVISLVPSVCITGSNGIQHLMARQDIALKIVAMSLSIPATLKETQYDLDLLIGNQTNDDRSSIFMIINDVITGSV